MAVVGSNMNPPGYTIGPQTTNKRKMDSLSLEVEKTGAVENIDVHKWVSITTVNKETVLAEEEDETKQKLPANWLISNGP